MFLVPINIGIKIGVLGISLLKDFRLENCFTFRIFRVGETQIFRQKKFLRMIKQAIFYSLE